MRRGRAVAYAPIQQATKNSTGNCARPKFVRGSLLLARANFAQGKLERAAALFERAAEIKPDDYQSVCLLIQVYRFAWP